MTAAIRSTAAKDRCPLGWSNRLHRRVTARCLLGHIARIAVVSALVGGCQIHAEEAAYNRVDAEVPVPSGRPTEFVPPSILKGEQKPRDPSRCGYGTGRRSDGQCAQLGLRTSTFSQQLYLPFGRVLIGTRAAAYEWESARAGEARSWPAQPRRALDVSPFWIDVIEVTRRAYADCVRSGQCTSARCTDGDDGLRQLQLDQEDLKEADRLPQTCVTQAQAQAYCQAQGGTLPSEAQWIYAARGAKDSVFPWGNTVRDEIGLGMLPVGTLLDASFFGILGLAVSGVEWTSDTYDVDANLLPYLTGPFRRPDGPLRQLDDSYERRLLCGSEDAKCKVDPELARRWIVKGMRVDRREAVYGSASVDPSLTQAPEGWLAFAHSSRLLGFRCVYPQGPSDESLTLPELPDPPKMVVGNNTTQDVLFTGIAAFVDRDEAERYCQRLRVVEGEQVQEDWALPTLDAINAFAGEEWLPSSLWLAGKRAAKAQNSPQGRTWVEVAAVAGQPRQAVCVHKSAAPAANP